MAHVTARACALLAVALVGGSGCRHEAPERGPVPAEPSAAQAKAAAGPELHEPTFDLVMTPAGAIVAGQPSAAEIRVDAKSGYHINDKYPYKFKPAVSPGVAYASPVFGADAAKLEEKRATMTVRFTPEGKGDKTIAGLFAFSLCSVDQCLIEKRDVSLHVTSD
jgi:hypothetical protein